MIQHLNGGPVAQNSISAEKSVPVSERYNASPIT